MCVCAYVYEYCVQRANLPESKLNTNNDQLVAQFLNIDDDRFDFGFNGNIVKSTALFGASLYANEVWLMFFYAADWISRTRRTLLEEALEILQLCLPYFNVALFVNALTLKDNFKKMRVSEAKEKKNVEKKFSFGESTFL